MCFGLLRVNQGMRGKAAQKGAQETIIIWILQKKNGENRPKHLG